jgi:hypothetical protein
MLALLYVFGPPIAFLLGVFVMYAVNPILGWMVIGAGWGLMLFKRRH